MWIIIKAVLSFVVGYIDGFIICCGLYRRFYHLLLWVIKAQLSFVVLLSNQAQLFLGVYFTENDEHQQDFEQAASFFRAAADQNVSYVLFFSG